jgi:hypothetical protein
VLFGAITLSTALDLEGQGVEVVGTLPQGLPTPAIPAVPLADYLAMVLPAIGVLLVAYSEALGVAREFAEKHGYEIDADQELNAHAVVNLGSGLFGGMLAAGGMSGSAVKEGAGARTQVANLVAWGATIVTLLFLTPAALGEQHPLLVGLERYGTEVRRYLVVRTELGLFAAVLSALLLFVLGVPLPLLWAVLVFVASFIPNIGALIAVIPPTVLAYLDGGIGVAAAVIIGYALINLVQDQFLQPVVMGSELNLSPLAVFIAVVVWVWILGPAGALLAVPLTVALVMLLESSPSSQGIASLFRDRVDPDPGTTS